MKGKQVKLGSEIAAFTLRGELHWTDFMSNRYSDAQEKLQMTKAWVESD